VVLSISGGFCGHFGTKMVGLGAFLRVIELFGVFFWKILEMLV
jgi:hypothetical protein